MVKSGKEKDRKSGSQRKKKSDGPDIPWKEALLAYEWVAINDLHFLMRLIVLPHCVRLVLPHCTKC